jgi:hypothetical protein
VSRAAGLRPLPPLARGPVLGIAALVSLVLLALSGRYGYHRDELYFLACGRHLAWGYPDQPPLTPLLARLMSDIDSTSLVVLRLPSDLAAAVVVVMTGVTTRELGGRRAEQALACGVMAVSGLLLASSHLLSTTTFDDPLWAVFIWVVLRILRTGQQRLWVVAGLVAGINVFDSDLIAMLAAALAVGVLVAGPRRVFTTPWVYLGALIAGLLWTPYLVWQASHGWPELSVAHSIASGGSGTSAPRWQLLPFQVLLVAPWLTPVWVAGLVALWRRPGLRWCRSFGVAWLALLVIVTVTGGKPYYLGGLYPLLIGAGAQSTISWVRRRRSVQRMWLLRAGFVLSAPGLLITLPILPVASLHRTPIVDINYDAGETVGWPGYVRQIAAVYMSLPVGSQAGAAVLTSNYGEAGAVDRYGSPLGLPSAFCGQNAYWLWGPPPSSVTTVVAVGLDVSTLHQDFRSVRLAAQLHNGYDVDDDEQDTAVYVAATPRRPWSRLWPGLQDYG